MKYNVTITEILEKTIEIEAENETNAIDIAKDNINCWWFSRYLV